jgi:hypothetical protein
MALHIIDVAPTGGEVMASTSTVRASGTAPDHRKLNGPQTTGREYRSLSEPEYGMRRDDDVPVPMRDGVRLLTDVHRPDSDGRFPAMNVPLHLPGTFTALRELADRTTVRVGMLSNFGLTWPWESLEFRHAPIGTSTTNTISYASRLLFPVLDESDGGLDA